MADILPEQFDDLSAYAAAWALPTRRQRYAARLERPYPELEEFYDAVAPRAEAAVEYLDAQDIRALTAQDTRLMHLLYSFILVSYAVNIFHQNRIPDSGAAFFDMVAEPAL